MLQRPASGLWLFAVLVSSVIAPVALAQPQSASSEDVDIKTYQDWEVRCPTSGDERCEMTQLVKGGEERKPILRVVMGYPKEIDTAAMIFVLPLGTRLAPGVQFSVDDGKPRTIPFQICLEQGCRADFAVDDSLRRKLRAGKNATVSLLSPSGDRIDLEVSLQGFTAADNRIQP